MSELLQEIARLKEVLAVCEKTIKTAQEIIDKKNSALRAAGILICRLPASPEVDNWLGTYGHQP